MIQDHCHLYKIISRVQNIAQARYASILRIRIMEKEANNSNNGNGTNGNNNGQKMVGNGNTLISGNSSTNNEGNLEKVENAEDRSL